MYSITDTDDKEAAKRQRSVEPLTRVAGASRDEVSVLPAEELARLGRDARVRNYLYVLATASVRGMLLRRNARGVVSS